MVAIRTWVPLRSPEVPRLLVHTNSLQVGFTG